MPRTLFFIAVCLLLAGCSSAPSLITISGKVTLDGQPLEKGDMIFISDDPKFGQEPAKITSGTYTANVHPGPNKVQIRATREVPGKFGPMGTEPLLEDIIPAQFNTATTLNVEVTKEKKDGYDFDLKTK